MRIDSLQSIASRLLTTDYVIAIGDISMYALAEIASRLPTTDYRPLSHHLVLPTHQLIISRYPRDRNAM